MTEKNDEMENEAAEPRELQRSPSTLSINTGSKLLRLKRSLAFMRSKSVENFFQRSYSDARLPTDITDDAPPPSPPLQLESSLPDDSLKPSLSPSLLVQQKPRPAQTHCFLDHVFRRPTSCQLCKHVIVGNSKQGLRCRTCKISAHLWCTAELSQQPCQGKVGMFKRNFSTPSITSNHSASKEAETTPGVEEKVRVDPVYATLRYGTSLAQLSRSSFESVCESPTHSLGDGGDEKDETEMELEMEERVNSDTENANQCAAFLSFIRVVLQVPRFHSIHTYVALYKFLPQEQNDLELRPGDRVQVTDDSNEEWWKGKSGDRVGFFPANFVQRVRPGESVWRVTQGTNGNRQIGHMTVKEDQVR
ncbi:SH3 and cysteine-rich domain-containing protein isoform X2 [Silurus meridionalis]|nr:SH3 and cysteine-rich domain-containing protein isoform X2 [Silurus meridionalis]